MQQQIPCGDDNQKSKGKGKLNGKGKGKVYGNCKCKCECYGRSLRDDREGKGKRSECEILRTEGCGLWGKGRGLIYLAHRVRNEHLPQMLGTKRAMDTYLCSA